MVTKKEGDGEHPSSHYLVVEDAEHPSTWHLRVRDASGKPDHRMMGAAWAALHGGYRGNKYEGPDKAGAIAKLKALYKSEGMDLPSAMSDREIGRSGDRVNGENWSSDHPITRSPDPFAHAPRFVMMLAEPPVTGLIRIPIAVTGKWKGAEKEFSIGLDNLNDIRENFAKKPTGEINVDYEHASEVPFGTGGPVLSAGRIVKLDEPEPFENGNSKFENRKSAIENHKFILWGWYEPTDRARQLIANHEYRYVSPAIRWGTKDKVTGKTQGTALTSVALVNKPFLEELPQIHLCEVQDSGFSPPRREDSGKAASRTFVSLQQLHVPGPVNQVSVAYQQPGNSQESGSRGVEESKHKGENAMAKSLKLKCLTDAHLEKHDLPAEHKGKIGVFDGEELIGVAEGPEGWEPKEGNGAGNGQDGKKLAELFATEIGLPGKSLVDIAAMVKRGTEAPQDQFAALSESIHDGRINLLEAGKLADAGRVRFSTILQAQEAEHKVEAAVKAGKVLPKNRAHALKLALSDAAAFAALVEQARPVVDLRSHGHAGGGEQPTAQQALMAEVNAYAKENKCSVSVALSEVTKRKPDLWRDYSEEIVTAVEAAQEEE
jgi:phage I-like protein